MLAIDPQYVDVRGAYSAICSVYWKHVFAQICGIARAIFTYKTIMSSDSSISQSDSELECGISCVLQMFRTYSAHTGVCESFPRIVYKHKPPVMEG